MGTINATTGALPDTSGLAPQQAAEANIAAAQQFFAGFGIGNAQGNGAIKTTIGVSDGTGYLPQTDAIEIGFNPLNGKNEAYSGDVIAHEYTHRILQNLHPGFGFGGAQNAAVSESLADTFAVAIDGNDWTIGEDELAGGLRSLASGVGLGPNGSGQYVNIQGPTNVSGFVQTNSDSGGAHINASIPNQAAYQIGTALGKSGMANVYMRAIQAHIPANAGFQELANATQVSAEELYGGGSAEAQLVQSAWAKVGVTTQPSTAPQTNAVTGATTLGTAPGAAAAPTPVSGPVGIGGGSAPVTDVANGASQLGGPSESSPVAQVGNGGPSSTTAELIATVQALLSQLQAILQVLGGGGATGGGPTVAPAEANQADPTTAKAGKKGKGKGKGKHGKAHGGHGKGAGTDPHPAKGADNKGAVGGGAAVAQKGGGKGETKDGGEDD